MEAIDEVHLALKNLGLKDIEAIKKKPDFPQPDVADYEIAVAVKKDDEKVKMHLLPPKALLGIAKIMTYGALKYNNFNYKLGKGLDWDRMLSACYRHLNAWNDGEDNDKESGESHLYHAGCCIMMLIDLVETKKGRDTRYKG